MRPSLWGIAWQAIRPRTLTLSLSPVLLGTSLAWAQGSPHHWQAFLASLLAACLIQMGTNLHNDAVDFEKGNDQPDRPGPLRVTAAGWVSGTTVKNSAIACFAGAFALGMYLVQVGGWPIVGIGLAALWAGWSYSGGSRPISYSPLGEVFVLAFFGFAAVLGAAWLQGSFPNAISGLAALICGLPAAAVLLVNNTRDRDADQRVGRRTLAVLLGQKGATQVYRGLMLTPYGLLILLAGQGFFATLLGLFALPAAWHHSQQFRLALTPKELAPLLPATAKNGFLLSLLTSLGFLVSALISA